jgi:hypothetical protein
MEIARYFWEETNRTHDAEGINLWRDGKAYCYLWVEAMVDHDMWIDYLLDVRTHSGDRDFDETRDFLFVSYRHGKLEVDWHQHPVKFDDEWEQHRERHRAGLHWFADKVMGAIDTENFE